MSIGYLLEELASEMREVLSNWDVKGIIDSNQNVYTISQDTKLLSKIFELYVTPILFDFADRYDLEILPALTQIQYPDYSLRGEALGIGDRWLALDLKSTMRDPLNHERIGGFTLGSFRGALRNNTTTQYSRFPYDYYGAHWCLCFVYSRSEVVSENTVYSIEDLHRIPDTIENIEIYVQEKYKIAWHTPGSGNTANIGSVKNITALREGTGPFSEMGEHVFEEYWRNYMRREDAIRLNIEQPYNNIPSFLRWRNSR